MLDGKTRATSSLPAGRSGALGEITVPFVVVQNPGYLNLHQFGAYDLLENAGTPPDQRRLIIGPPAYELPAYHWQLEALAFFDHLVHGADNGYADQARVRYWVQGIDAYRAGSGWPLPGSTAVRLYLTPNGADAATHRLAPEPPPDGCNRRAAVPLGTVVCAGFDMVANQKLGYAMSVEEEIELTGPLTLSLSFSSNKIDSHVVARTDLVSTNGTWRILSMGRSARPAAGSMPHAPPPPRSSSTSMGPSRSCPGCR